MSRLVFIAVVSSTSALVALLVFSIVRPSMRVWPPPQRNQPAWRVRRVANRITGVLVAPAGAGVLGIGVLLGFGVLCSSKLGLLAGAVCSIWFLTAPFAEEPWLREHLGARYDDYSLSTPRFLGIPKRGPTGGAPSRHRSC
jgi:protein-S-isoprenylcysteine O-methyltransferase Ste14